MIKYFAIENYRSIKQESLLQIEAGYPVIGLTGRHGSGKTTILEALVFVLWFMQDSFGALSVGDPIPIVPFYSLFDAPSRFHLIFSKIGLVEGVTQPIDYEYIMELTPEAVLSESLYYYPYGRQRVAYIRAGDEVTFGHSVPHFPTGELRQNCSLISLAAQFPSQEVARSCHDYLFYENVPPEPADWSILLESRGKTQEVLKMAGVGIESIQLEETDKTVEKFLRLAEERAKTGRQPASPQIRAARRAIASGRADLRTALFRHNIEGYGVDFGLALESKGTLKLLALLQRILSALAYGGLLLVDDIEANLHPDIVGHLIGLLQDRRQNKKQAQLIFSFYNPALTETMASEQLWLVAKNEAGQTVLSCAADNPDYLV